MAHPQQFFYIETLRSFLPQYFENCIVLEVGSLNINGSIRQYFGGCDYTGLDVGPGRDVDVICPGEDFVAPSAHFDMIVSCEAMEHNPNWKLTWLNMLRMLKRDGLMVMTCASIGRKQHGTEEFNPADSPLTIAKKQNYYRNLIADDFKSVADLDVWFSRYGFYGDHESYDLYFFGVGRGASADALDQAASLDESLTEYYFNKNILGMY